MWRAGKKSRRGNGHGYYYIVIKAHGPRLGWYSNGGAFNVLSGDTKISKKDEKVGPICCGHRTIWGSDVGFDPIDAGETPFGQEEKPLIHVFETTWNKSPCGVRKIPSPLRIVYNEVTTVKQGIGNSA